MSAPAPHRHRHRHRRARRWLVLVWTLAWVNVAVALGLASTSFAGRLGLLAAEACCWAVVVYRARHLRAVSMPRLPFPAPPAHVIGGPLDGLLWSTRSAAGELPAQLWLPAGDAEHLYRLTPSAGTSSGATGGAIEGDSYWYQNRIRNCR